MHAIAVDGDSLRWTEGSTPVPGPGEIAIDVVAAGVNRADLLQRAGRYPPPPGASPILGLECSGTVAALGDDAGPWRIGDRVCALLAGGGYATRAVVPAPHALPVPVGVDLVAAAGLPEAFTTAIMVLHREAAVRRGERVLIHAGASGIGTAAIQVAVAAGASCFATAGGLAKGAACRALGAEATFDRHAGPWRDAVSAWAPDGVDVIVDPVGGSYLEDNQAVLAPGGRIVTLGLLGGRRGTLDLGRLLIGRQRVIGTVLRSRGREDKAALVADVAERVWPGLATGRIRPVIDTILPIHRADEAHRRMGADDTIGKIVLTVGDPAAA